MSTQQSGRSGGVDPTRGGQDAWGADYVRLAFRLEKHVPGLVDGYLGPAELRDDVRAESETSPAAALAQDADSLSSRLSSVPFDEHRKAFLRQQLRALQTIASRAAGSAMPLADEVEACFGIRPRRVRDSELRAARNDLDTLLPGRGGLRTRMAAWRDSFDLPADRVMPLVDQLLPELRRRAAEIVELPAGESLNFALVTGKPWAGYNWYLGDFRSRIEICTDLPVKAHILPNLVAHEAYPGHHTERAVKEGALWRQRGWLESSILLINTPDCLISEGLATLALEAVIPQKELADWLRHVYLPAAGKDPDEADRIVAIESAAKRLHRVMGNGAFMLHEDRRPAAEVAEYLATQELRSLEEAGKSVDFLSNPLWRSYIFTYLLGADLLRGWLERVGWKAGFRRLLSEELYPAELAAVVRSQG